MHIALGINPTVHHTGKIEQITKHVCQCGQDDQHVDGWQQGVRSGCKFAERPTQALAHPPIMPQDPNSVETDMFKPKFSPIPSQRILGGLVIVGLLVSETAVAQSTRSAIEPVRNLYLSLQRMKVGGLTPPTGDPALLRYTRQGIESH